MTDRRRGQTRAAVEHDLAPPPMAPVPVQFGRQEANSSIAGISTRGSRMQMSIIDARPFATRDGTNVNILVPTTTIPPR